MEKKITKEEKKRGKGKFKSYSEMIDFLTEKKKRDGRLNELGEWLLSRGKDRDDFWVVKDMKAVLK